MEQLPISAHVAVISHSGGKLPDANANGVAAPAGADNFADVLAAQFSAQDVNGSGVASAPQGSQPALPVEAPVIEVNAAPSDKAAEQATQQLAEVLSALPLPYLPLSSPLANPEAIAKELSNARLPSGGSTIAGLSPGSVATLGAEIKPEAGLNVAASAEDEAAIIAASDKALPSKQLNFEVGEAARPVLLTPTQMPSAARTEAASMTHTAPPVPLAVDIKVGTPGWDTAFSQKVAWAATNQHQVAELRLNPPHLGPIEIRITITNDQATAMFVSGHASVRESIEAALPRLREMMGESGLTLGNVNVSSQSFQQQQQADQGAGKSPAKQGGVMSELALDSALPGLSSLAVVRHGLVDIFA